MLVGPSSVNDIQDSEIFWALMGDWFFSSRYAPPVVPPQWRGDPAGESATQEAFWRALQTYAYRNGSREPQALWQPNQESGRAGKTVGYLGPPVSEDGTVGRGGGEKDRPGPPPAKNPAQEIYPKNYFYPPLPQHVMTAHKGPNGETIISCGAAGFGIGTPGVNETSGSSFGTSHMAVPLNVSPFELQPAA